MSKHELINRLKEPFPVSAIHWRVGSVNAARTKGIALAYIDARDAMERLDTVVGPENWQRRYPWASDKKLCCEVGIRINDEWIWKGDGAGDTNYEAEKGAFSDSFKRACVNWGIARYLYDLPNVWVEIEAKGSSFVIPEAVQANLTRRLLLWQEKRVETKTLQHE